MQGREEAAAGAWGAGTRQQAVPSDWRCTVILQTGENVHRTGERSSWVPDVPQVPSESDGTHGTPGTYEARGVETRPRVVLGDAPLRPGCTWAIPQALRQAQAVPRDARGYNVDAKRRRIMRA